MKGVQGLSFLLLLVLPIVLSFDQNVLDELDTFNHRALQKTQKYLRGELNLKKYDAPSEREKHWALLRKDDKAGNVVPMHRYVEAKQYIEDHLSYVPEDNHKRAAEPTLQWTSIGPTNNKIDGGRTRALVVLPTTPPTLFAGAAAGGIWKSVNGGASWVPLGDLLANLAVNSMVAVDATTLYAGTGEGFFNIDARRGTGIFKTTDGGNTWTLLANTINNNFYYVNKLALSPNSSSKVYAATRTGLWVSTDAGSTWTRVLTTSQNAGIVDAAVFNNGGTDYVYAYEANAGIWVSTNNGDSGTFSKQFGPTTTSNLYYRGSLAVAQSNTAFAYCSISDSSGTVQFLARTSNSGATWSNVLTLDTSTVGRLNKVLFSNPIFSYVKQSGLDCFDQSPSGGYGQGWYDNAIAVDPTNHLTVFVGGIDMFRSTDGGVSFSQLSNWWTSGPNYLHADQHTIVFSPTYATDSTIYFGNDGGVFKSTNAATALGQSQPCSFTPTSQVTFTPLNEGYATLQFYHGSVSRSGATYVAGAQDNGSWKYTGPGVWISVNGGDGGFTAVDYNSQTRFYSSYTNLNIYRHDAGTDSYEQILGANNANVLTYGNGLFINPFIMDPNNPSIIYTCNTRLWRTTTATVDPVSWSSVGSLGYTSDPDGAVTALAIAKDSSVMYLGDAYGNFWRVTLSPTVGTPVAVGSGSLCPSCGSFSIGGITVHPTNPSTVYVTVSTFGDPHLWKSTDQGSTWVSIGAALPDVPTLALFILPTNTDIMYLGTDLGVLYSSDAGVTWTSISQYGLANVPVENFDYQDGSGTLFAFTHGRGAYSVVLGTGTSTTTGSSVATSVVASFALVVLCILAAVF